MSEEEILEIIKNEIKEFREEENSDWPAPYMEMSIQDYAKIINAVEELLKLYEEEKEKNNKAIDQIEKLEPTEELFEIEEILKHVPIID